MSTCNTYDVGLWTRQHSDVFLKACDERGACILSADKATPADIEVMLVELEQLTDKAAQRIADAETTVFSGPQKVQLLAELDAWRDRLAEYQALTLQALETGGGPTDIWHCVTAPLLVGWEGNADCTGPRPDQLEQGQPDVATPLKLLNGALCLQASTESAADSVREYFEALSEGLLQVASDLSAAAEAAANAVSSVARTAAKSPGSLLLLGAAVVGLVYLYRK